MNINEMSAQDCADWLGDIEKWKWKESIEMWERPDGLLRTHFPFQLTLDSAAAALREPWAWDSIEWYTAHVEAVVRNTNIGGRLYMQGHDELTARYRAVVAARMEDSNGHG